MHQNGEYLKGGSSGWPIGGWPSPGVTDGESDDGTPNSGKGVGFDLVPRNALRSARRDAAPNCV